MSSKSLLLNLRIPAPETIPLVVVFAADLVFGGKQKRGLAIAVKSP